MGQPHGRDTKFFAHTVPGAADTTCWELLPDHLNRVSDLSGSFTAQFRAEHWGRLAGLLHDLGKYSGRFQSYLRCANGFEAHLEQHTHVDHSTAGAQRAVELFPVWGKILAYVIAGHHAGLPNAHGTSSSIEDRLKKPVDSYRHAPPEFLSPPFPISRPELAFHDQDQEILFFQVAFFTRMVFSSLVDADFLATEEFLSPEQAFRRVGASDLNVMREELDQFLKLKTSAAAENVVTRNRQLVLSACRAAATQAPGFFSLTVPTGGGKTLSSLAFALNHAVNQGLKRIIYAIPFTSIIEQTAGVFREVFKRLGNDIVLEHHSNIDPMDEDQESVRSRLAAENWDAPLVVTTNVQFFESLFAARTSRCRKLHRIANSVIILDEAQALPPDRLRPCLAVLDELVRNYGCTVVLCTATQPAIEFSEQFRIGLQNVREIIPDRESLYREMKRVKVQSLGSLSDTDLIDRLAQHESALTIVNTRGHAAKLYRDLVDRAEDDEGIYHLSTLMCGQHRSEVLSEIRQRLKEKRRCQVISTQLIEAGVDVDFPVVYRALCGLDSIAQAAGRCNREGNLPTATVFIFEPTEIRLRGSLASMAQSAREVLPTHADLLDPAAIREYFDLHYWKQSGENRWDKTKEQGVMNCFPGGKELAFNFRDAADRFQLIENEGVSVLVPYRKEGERLLEVLRADGPSRQLMRRLQRYTVTLYEQLYHQMRCDIEIWTDPAGRGEFPILVSPGSYDDKLGVRIDRPGYLEPVLSVF